MQPGDVLCTYADIGKARRVLGYAPQVPSRRGLSTSPAWFARQG